MFHQHTEFVYNLFAGRPDVYAIRIEFADRAVYVPSNADTEGAKRVVKKYGVEYTQKVVEAHLKGDIFIGIYPIWPDSNIYWFALDFDGKNGDPWKAAVRQAEILWKEAGLPVYIERSQSGSGYHVWGFLDEPVNAGTVRHALRPFLEDADTYDRMFPCQDGVLPTRPLGNLIALPLHGGRVKQGYSVFVRRGKDGQPEVIEDQIAYLESIRTIPAERILELFHQAGPYVPESVATPRQESVENLKGAYKVTHPRFGCEFIRWCYEHPEDVTEPLWYALACQFAQLEGGRELFHEWSARDKKRYDPEITDKKFDHALEENKPHSCEAIRELGGHCECDRRFPGKVFHPFDLAKLKFKELVESIESVEDSEGLIVSASEGFEQAIEWVEAVERDPSIGQGYRYGIPALDAATGLRKSDLVIIAARPGMGKAQPLSAQVLTPRGFVRMGDVKAGDYVIAADGKPARVLGVYPQGVKKIYRVHFDDGSWAECCEEHLWYTTTRADRRAGRDGSVKELREIMQTLRVGSDSRVNHQIPWMKPAEFKPLGSLPISPYVLGVYLGDGSTARASARFHNLEPDVAEKVARLLPAGDALTISQDGHTHYVVRSGCSGRSRVFEVLEEMGLTRCSAASKFIPAKYMFASVAERIELLRGLLDTDGYVVVCNGHERGCTIEYVTVSETLANDVCFLVGSLGGRVTMRTREPYFTYNGERKKGQLAYRLFISFPGNPDIIPVSSEKHLARYQVPSRCLDRGIVDVRYVRDEEAQCIYIDHDSHLYVTDNFVVTHNTAFAGFVMDQLVQQGVPNYFFSLEMSSLQFYKRQLSVVTGVSQTRMTTGQLTPTDWEKIREFKERLRNGSYLLFVDDISRSSDRIFEVAAELFYEHGEGVIWIDYLQLMQRLPRESMFDAVTRITHDCKLLAKALNAPVVALTQLNRTADDATGESQTMDSWLRGCLTGDTRILRADTNTSVTIAELAHSGERNIPVWTVDSKGKLVVRTMTEAFSNGVRTVYELRLRSGRVIKATDNHPFLTITGWVPLGALSKGSSIAIPRRLPSPLQQTSLSDEEIILLAHLLGDGHMGGKGASVKYTSASSENVACVGACAEKLFDVRVVDSDPDRSITGAHQLAFYSTVRLTHGKHNPLTDWLRRFGLYGARSHTKFIPGIVFGLEDSKLALFLRHLWATDGCVRVARSRRGGPKACVYYSTTSRRLADDVALLLLRFGIVSRIYTARKEGYKESYQVWITGCENIRRFIDLIGVYGQKAEHLEDIRHILAATKPNSNVDTIPQEVYTYLRRVAEERGLTWKDVTTATRGYWTGKTSSSMSREMAARYAEVLQDEKLLDLATSDLFWDRVESIRELGQEEVFDATVPGTHNFIANGVVVHNSGDIEQAADVIIFILGEKGPGVKERILVIHKERHREAGIRLELEFNQPIMRWGEKGSWMVGIPLVSEGSAPQAVHWVLSPEDLEKDSAVVVPTVQVQDIDLFRGF